MTTKNPWLGLASYEEPKNDGNDYQFCGRDEETLDVVRLIDNNLFITLYGSSGIGKTSLLRAGVIPILRRKDYFPLYVRLSQEPAEISYAEAIVRKLQSCGLTEERSTEIKHDDGNDRLYFWNYFATTRLLKDGREVYPVIILDQFEEVFREGDKAKADLLLKQIYLLLSDELEMPDEAGYSADTNYRFVASIREDFLFVLEDSIDENSLDLYKNNRYRLRPMRPAQARQVVLVPGRDCIEESDKDKVADHVVALAKRNKRGDIDTLLLSLVCSGSFDKKTGEKITLSDLAIWKNNPMEVYYQDAVKGLSATQVRYIQQHLIREDGSRRRVDAEEVKADLGETIYHQLTQGKNRLFAIGDKGQVELLHDQLGMAVWEERKAFEERERKKKYYWIISCIIVCSLLFIGIVALVWLQNTALNKIEWEFKNLQSSRVADKAVSLVDEDSYLARILSLEVLPKDLNEPDRPYRPEAEKALRMACLHKSAIFYGTEGTGYYAGFSPDGKQIVSRLKGNTLIVWNAESGAILSTKTIDSAYMAKYSPDGKRIVSASPNSLKMWDSETGILLWETDVYNPHCISFSPDGKQVIFASGAIIKTIDAATSKELLSLKGHEDRITRLSLSPDGRRIVSISCKELFQRGYARYEKEGTETLITENDANTINTIVIWDAETGEKLMSFPAHFSYINSVAFSQDGKQFVTTSFDYNTIIWDVTSGKEIQKMKWTLNSVARDAVFTPDGNKVVTGHVSGHIRIWDVQTGEEIKKWKGHSAEVYSVAVSPDGQRIVSTSNDASMKLWDIELLNDSNVLAIIDTDVSNAITGPCNENIMFVSQGEDFISVFNTKTCTHYELDEFPDVCNWITFSPDGKLFAASSAVDGDGTLMIWNTKTGKAIHSLAGHTNWISTISISPDGKQLISSSWDRTTRFWDIETGNETRQLQLLTNSIVFSPDMKVIAFAESGSTKALLCDAKTLDTLMMLEGHLSSISKLFYSPNGKIIASSDDNATTKLWDSETGECLHSIKGYFVSFSPNSKYCILKSNLEPYKTNDIYNTETGHCIHSISRKTDTICCASFSEDGLNIITVLSNGTICQWPFPPLQDLIDQTRERFKDRPLTDEERRLYYLE